MDIEQLIKELNDPKNQSLPETIDEIQKQIQRRQREPSAWQLGLDLLSNDEAVMRFYGALTLTIKINADWYERASPFPRDADQTKGHRQGRG